MVLNLQDTEIKAKHFDPYKDIDKQIRPIKHVGSLKETKRGETNPSVFIKYLFDFSSPFRQYSADHRDL